MTNETEEVWAEFSAWSQETAALNQRLVDLERGAEELRQQMAEARRNTFYLCGISLTAYFAVLAAICCLVIWYF